MRIVSLAPSNTEILYALGVADQVAAVTRFCDWPPAVQGKLKVGTWLATEPEKLTALHPDLILTSYFTPPAVRDWAGPGRVVHVEPKNLWDVFESIRVIGEAVGAEPAAEAAVGKMKERLDHVRAGVDGRVVRAYLEEWFAPPMVAGNWVPELVAVAGGEAVLGEVGRPSRSFPFAALAVADPDVVVCHWCGWGERTDPSRVTSRPGWGDLRALREGRVSFVNDSLLNRPGPRLAEGAAMLQRILQSSAAGSR